MQDNFILGLEVTAIGMGLVFLTLVIIMVAIQLLGRAFRVKAAAEPAAVDLTIVEARDMATPVPEVTPLAGDEATAIATAIALERSKAGQAAAVAVAIRLEQQRNGAGQEVQYGELEPEVVTVAAIEPRSGGWANYGRLQSTTR